MKMLGEYIITADRATVWAGLNDPETLKACIPGCEDLNKTADDQFDAIVVAKVGPIKAKFNGAVTLCDIVEGESYRIDGRGKGGAAGYAKGGASVKLTDVNGGTRLSYEVDAVVGGKLASVGARFIDSTAKKMAEEFFDAFALRMGGPAASDDEIVAEEAPTKYPPMLWLAIGGAVIGLVLVLAYTGIFNQ